MSATAPAAPFIRAIELAQAPGYLAQIPAIGALERLELHPRVTFFVGDNGSGKSTLVEAMAAAAKFNREGGGRVVRFATRRPSEDEPELELDVEWAPVKPVNGFFLRAESFFNFATAIEGGGPLALLESNVYDASLHERSHGESFLDLVLNRFGPRGLYILDEPEAALSVRGQLALMRRMHELVEAHSQFVVATHSPILVGYPDATIYELSDDGIVERAYEEIDQVALTRSFVEDRDRFLRYLLGDE